MEFLKQKNNLLIIVLLGVVLKLMVIMVGILMLV